MEPENLRNRPIVLIVEDDPYCLDMEIDGLALASDGRAKIDSASSLSEALINISKKKYDAIILDLNLPDSSGSKTFSAISHVFSTCAIYIVTGLYTWEAEKLLGQAAKHIITKDCINYDTLWKSILETKTFCYNKDMHDDVRNEVLKVLAEMRKEREKITRALSFGS